MMQFDDRLATVLRLAASGETLARIQYRQLLDLLGTMPAGHWSETVDAAYLRLAELNRRLPAVQRARLVRDAGLRLRSPRLVSVLAGAEPQVAEAAMMRADLAGDEWLDLVPALPIAARAMVRARAGSDARFDSMLRRLGVRDRALPDMAEALSSADPLELVTEADDAVAPDLPTGASVTRIDDRLRSDRRLVRAASDRHDPASGSDAGGAIRAIVQRIEEFRKIRHASEPGMEDAPRLPLGEPASRAMKPLPAFDFATDAQASIVWAEGAAGPMVVGHGLDREDTDPRLRLALRRQLPLRGGEIRLDGAAAVSGHWRIDATPRFDPANGRFTGYVGRMRRTAPGNADSNAASPSGIAASGENDRMRQILHELRTPVNGVQGCAELMQQAVLGPIPHEYRALAATIAAEAARILAAFDEFDRLVKLDAGTCAIEPGECDLAAVVQRTIAQLEAYTRPRNSGFALDQDTRPVLVPFDESEMESLVWRLLSSLAGAAAPGEVLRLKLRRRDGFATLSIRLPAQLAGHEDEMPLSAPEFGTQALSPGAFGAGFAMRLAEAEARAAGGHLERRGGKLRLTLPDLTSGVMLHSHSGTHGSI